MIRDKMDIEEILLKRLKKRENQGNLRDLYTSQGLVDFVSNDYLGLARSVELQSRINRKTSEGKQFLNGATGSRLLSGNTREAEDLESYLAHVFRAPGALLFNSGYVANLALLSAVPQKNDTIIYDEYIHACIKEGARLSLANRFTFRHNDLNDLESKLTKASGSIFVVVESVYSMDGDFCPLEAILEVSKKYGANVIIDEAHSTGILGERGCGFACSMNLENEIFARVYTFGKAMGVHGACIVGSKSLRDYLINFARPFIYTTALPPHSIVAIRESFGYLIDNMSLQSELEQRITFFKNRIKEELKDNRDVRLIESSSAIQAIIYPGNKRVRQVAKQINEQGFDVRPILSPTVKEGAERLRLCLHTYNTTEQIEGVIKSTVKSLS
ncbi:8-amino-7-oxononanoate synthase [Fulvivirgaceae bacterium BMA10]|uniref:8-amino-7-oxononanoate synthase n=1 Tax=Splendidivirga corallicola TaxID=3051826 RepID=A0ABT8KHF7_9BACT|nr:8-amino-7-oxononanoate synthase [Fulvivirgaceae bacterium BMA10]